ncbi:hypothetical protein NRB56_55100 [Nocardia sp. RB56]|uniref:Uncharacterized protein n=1 Tax=Nocardia aurantia TaxID=2585199 RepID=A0A7K0DVX3_9NOCA|nr:hypothetical protein [Nocardia aurantia]
MSNPTAPDFGWSAGVSGVRHRLATIEGVRDFSFAAAYSRSGAVAAR